MNDVAIFSAAGVWCKGNLHTHTKFSDGKLSPEDVIIKYKKMNYDFIAITDHRKYMYHKHLQSDHFIVIPGLEADINPPGQNICHHIVAVRNKISSRNFADGYQFTPPEYRGLETVQEVIDDLKYHDNFTFYCHPVWSGVDSSDFIGLDGLTGIEIFNTSCHITNNTGYSNTYISNALKHGKKTYVFAVDDCHQQQNDMGKGYIVVKADEKSEEGITDAIMKGRFYSSRGPSIYDFGIKNGRVYIKCSNVREIHFIADPFGRSFVGEKGELRCSASCNINKNWTSVRAEIIDNNGYQAWTNPIYLKNDHTSFFHQYWRNIIGRMNI